MHPVREGTYFLLFTSLSLHSCATRNHCVPCTRLRRHFVTDIFKQPLAKHLKSKACLRRIPSSPLLSTRQTTHLHQPTTTRRVSPLLHSPAHQAIPPSFQLKHRKSCLPCPHFRKLTSSANPSLANMSTPHMDQFAVTQYEHEARFHVLDHEFCKAMVDGLGLGNTPPKKVLELDSGLGHLGHLGAYLVNNFPNVQYHAADYSREFLLRTKRYILACRCFVALSCLLLLLLPYSHIYRTKHSSFVLDTSSSIISTSAAQHSTAQHNSHHNGAILRFKESDGDYEEDQASTRCGHLPTIV